MKRKGFFAASLAVAGSVACGQPEPAAAPTASPPPEPLRAEQAAPPAEPAATTAQASSEPAPPGAASEPTQPSLRDLCAKVCVKVAGKCSETVAENCNINCDQYDKTAAACQAVAREALTCSEAAKDLPCANMAPESCAKHFQLVAQCQRAPESFAVKTEEKKGIPSGWQELSPSDGGFVAVFPKDHQTSSDPKGSVWTATSGAVRYVIKAMPPPAEKFTPKSQVRLAGQWLAPCSLKLKLHGLVEKNDRTSIHYDVGCKDGTERHGMFHITKTALYVVGIEAPAGERGDLDTFVYGFRPK